jgi:AcrR family transcriptional regulator
MVDSSANARADITRARLLEAAVAAFAEKGFHGTTTRDIASAVGLSPAAVYVHHRSKEDLLYQIARAGHDQTLQLVRDGAASSDNPTGQLSAIVHAFAVHHARDHAAARVVNYELSALGPEHLRELLPIRHQIDEELLRVVQAGVRSGDFKTEMPRMAVVAILSLGIDIARWYRDDGDWSPEVIAHYYVETALRIVGAPGGAEQFAAARR